MSSQINQEKLSLSESNYLKALAQLTVFIGKEKVGTNELADFVRVKPASSNNMLQRLGEKGFVIYRRYKKVRLTALGMETAVQLVRSHRVWETFLAEQLDFTWSEIDQVASQLFYIQSNKLIDNLAELIGNPEFDPHGDPIPRKDGTIPEQKRLNLLEAGVGIKAVFAGVIDDSVSFLTYVDRIGLKIGDEIVVTGFEAYDNSVYIEFNDKQLAVTEKFARQIQVKLVN